MRVLGGILLAFSLSAHADYFNDLQGCVREINSKAFLKKMGYSRALGVLACAGGKAKETKACMLKLKKQKIKGIGRLDMNLIAHVCSGGSDAVRAQECLEEVKARANKWIASRGLQIEMAAAACAGGNDSGTAIDCVNDMMKEVSPLLAASVCAGGNSAEKAKKCVEEMRVSDSGMSIKNVTRACAGGNSAGVAQQCIARLRQPGRSIASGVSSVVPDISQASSLCSMIPAGVIEEKDSQ